jgi:hypothetical protein
MKLANCCFAITFVFLLTLSNAAQRPSYSIKKLLDKAKPGQTVRIPSGIFIEDIIVPPGVSLIGANARKTIIIGSLELSGTEQNPVSLSRVTIIHPGGRASRAITCKSGRVSIYNTYLTSEGSFAAVSAASGVRVLLRNNIIKGPLGDYAIFGRDRAEIEIINNTIIVQGFGIGLMDKSRATIRNCLIYGKTKPAVIRTDSDYSITYTNISLTGGSFYFNHDLINNDVQLRDASNFPGNATPADLSNKDASNYDSLGLTFHPQTFLDFKTIDEFRKNQPEFSKHAGSPDKKDDNADGTRNNLGAFGGAFGNKWQQ